MKTKKPNYNEMSNIIADVHSFGLNIYTREIFLTSHVIDGEVDDPGVDWRCANNFIRNLSLLEFMGRAKITVHMLLIPGGSYDAGMAIYHAIKSCKSYIKIITHGSANSMSSIILQAADWRVVSPLSNIMIHHGSISLSDSSQSVASAIKVNNKQCKDMVEIFANRAINGKYFEQYKNQKFGIKKVVDFINEALKANSDWYISAEDCIAYGFADEILLPLKPK
jgi:ATP-dependent protease ClpP protease subunit